MVRISNLSIHEVVIRRLLILHVTVVVHLMAICMIIPAAVVSSCAKSVDLDSTKIKQISRLALWYVLTVEISLSKLIFR